MNAIALLLIGLGAFGLGYVVYSRFIASRIYALDDARTTPAHEFEDGVDFVPTNRFILWGHHFTSIAGAAPLAQLRYAIWPQMAAVESASPRKLTHRSMAAENEAVAATACSAIARPSRQKEPK